MEQKKTNKALVIGAGIAGIKAALELAELGHSVYLCDRKPYIGGTLVQLDKWFPDNHCGMCKILPIFSRDNSSQYCLRRGLTHPNIEMLPSCEIKSLEGKAGDFTVSVRLESSGVKRDLCIGCGLCESACPEYAKDRFNEGLTKQKVIHICNPLSLSKNYIIDWESCTKCGSCVEVCPTQAIDLSLADEERDLNVGAIIVSTGFEEFDARLAGQYGYKRFPNVITSIELERFLSGTGPTQGKLIRPSDGQLPKSIAFIQCVGSRTVDRNYCSSACCMYSLKEATMIKQAFPDIDIHIYFMDMRAYGKGYHRYYEEARDNLGIKFTRCRVPRLVQNFSNHNLMLNAKTDEGGVVKEEFDLAVLAVGQTPAGLFEEEAQKLGIELNKWGFCKTDELSPIQTTQKGILVCGSTSGPKDIADTLSEASAAAGGASLFLTGAGVAVKGDSTQAADEGKIAVFVCNCGGEISKILDTSSLAQFTADVPGVASVEEVDYLCQQGTSQKVREKIRDIGAGKVVLAGCSALISDEILTDMTGDLVNIREGLAWVHQDDGEAALEKGKKLILMAVEKLKQAEPLPEPCSQPVTQRAIVVGGGLAGMIAALSIAEHGHQVDIIEKNNFLGGNLKHIWSTVGGSNVWALLSKLIDDIESSAFIRVWQETEVSEVKGHAGDFTVRLTGKEDEQHVLEAGAIVIATGASEYKPVEYLYGQNEGIITQSELEEKISSNMTDLKKIRSVAMIQCVGSRDEDRHYCSRICCQQALKNALRLKSLNPNLEVVIFYRDLMSYGFSEEFYTAARESGVVFARYELDNKPIVAIEGGQLRVNASDLVLGGEIIVNPDYVVLSAAIIPNTDNSVIADMIGVELTEDGFFEEAEVKFRPVDMLRDGIFVCGLAHSPKGISETIITAQAAAERARLVLSKHELSSGRVVSEVNETWCSGCELCIKACPYEARIKDTAKGVAVVIEALCQGCGACAMVCPNGAAKLRGFKDKQMFSALDAVL